MVCLRLRSHVSAHTTRSTKKTQMNLFGTARGVWDTCDRRRRQALTRPPSPLHPSHPSKISPNRANMDVHPWMDTVENSCPKNHARFRMRGIRTRKHRERERERERERSRSLFEQTFLLLRAGPRASRVVLPDGALCLPTVCHLL